MLWHSKPIEDVIEHFKVDTKNGLGSSSVQEYRDKYGSNDILVKKDKSVLAQLFEQFNEPVIYILIVAGIINGFIAEPKDSFVIGVVVILNTLIGFFQERRSSNALKSLKSLAAPNARVIRDGEQIQIPTTDVVCGDLIVLESGMRVPADARLIETVTLMVDEAMLTGESFPVNKRHKVLLEGNAALGDRVNLVYSGTIVQKGRGLGVVTAVGNQTEFGKISQKVSEAEEAVSPLQVKMGKFTKGLSFSIMIAIVVLFILGLIRNIDWAQMLLTSVGLAVSAIPEGLPVAVTITLTIGVSQMAKQRAVVKKLAAVETLGSTNVICTDKTGTLTKNQMIVTNLYIGDDDYNVSGSGYAAEGTVISKKSGKSVYINESPVLNYAAMVSGLCSETNLIKNEEEWEMAGDPTEAALMIAANKMGFNPKDYQVSIDIPFESEYQLMAVKAVKDGKAYILAKGAPEKIMQRSKCIVNSSSDEMPVDVELLKSKYAEFSRKGLRVLALAIAEISDIEHKITLENLQNLSLVGFAGIEDSIRPEVVKAVYECANAGITVKMITGDNARTAQAVAAAVGIGEGKEIPVAITGQELDEMSDEELFKRVSDIDVFARVAPQHKFRIVQQLQKNNNIVSMTGDGVNDAPALKQADIGVAMGSGTDVAKDSSHLVLMDDNFATIVNAVRRGRIVLHNLQHIILYILATSFGGILTITMSVVFGFPLPVLPAQLLWINLVTDGTSTFPLAFEKEHGDVMYFPPTPRNAPLIEKEMIYRIFLAGIIMMFGTLGVFLYYLGDNPYNPSDEVLSYAQTMAFCTLAFFQIWNVQNSRSVNRSLFFNLPHPGLEGKSHPVKGHLDRILPSRNPILLAVMLLAIGLQAAAVELPFMNKVMDTVNLTINDWLIIIGVSFSIIIAVEIIKVANSLMMFYGKNKRFKNI